MRLFNVLELLDEPLTFYIVGKSYTDVSGHGYTRQELKEVLAPALYWEATPFIAEFGDLGIRPLDEELSLWESRLKMISHTNSSEIMAHKFSQLAPALEILFAEVVDSPDNILKQELQLDKVISKNLLSYMDDLINDSMGFNPCMVDNLIDKVINQAGVHEALEKLSKE